jgi:hypothetical protein
MSHDFLDYAHQLEAGRIRAAWRRTRPFIIGMGLVCSSLYAGTWLSLAVSTDIENLLYADGTVDYERESPLRYQSPLVKGAFAPAEWIDRRVRPMFWRERSVHHGPAR